jgi:cytochrome b subunit of formate dehydrogenase
MEKGAKFDFQQHVPSKGSKLYFFRMAVYGVLLGAMGVFIWYKLNAPPAKKVSRKTELHFKKIELQK